MKEVLLAKNVKNNMIIRKQLTYYYFKALCFVDKDNNCTGYSNNAERYIISAEDMVEMDIKQYGRKKYEKLDPDTQLLIIRSYGTNSFPPISLERPVRGLRYATHEETNRIKEALVKKEAQRLHITFKDMFYNHENYRELYRLCMEADLSEILFKLEKNGELYK